tara:strand:+ start:27 stop:332 length:306 start_codon:yes stop_codon:yes gene_type:complete
MTDLYIRDIKIRLDYVENNDTIEEVILKIITMNDISKFPTHIKNDENFQHVVSKLWYKAFKLIVKDELLLAETTEHTLRLIGMMTKDIKYPTLINMLYNVC